MYSKKIILFVEVCDDVSPLLQKTFWETHTHHLVNFCKNWFFVKCGGDGLRNEALLLVKSSWNFSIRTSLYFHCAFMVKYSKTLVDLERKIKFSSMCLLGTGTTRFLLKCIAFFSAVLRALTRQLPKTFPVYFGHSSYRIKFSVAQLGRYSLTHAHS